MTCDNCGSAEVYDGKCHSCGAVIFVDYDWYDIDPADPDSVEDDDE